MGAYQPEKGHFIYLDFTPQAGTEQAGRRPALVLSPIQFNIAVGLIYACPVTNEVKGSPFEVAIPAGAKITGVVLTDHLKSLDWIERNADFHSQAPTDLVEDVLAKIESIIL